jgi:hypothetical protein
MMGKKVKGAGKFVVTMTGGGGCGDCGALDVWISNGRESGGKREREGEKGEDKDKSSGAVGHIRRGPLGCIG